MMHTCTLVPFQPEHQDMGVSRARTFPEGHSAHCGCATFRAPQGHVTQGPLPSSLHKAPGEVKSASPPISRWLPAAGDK